MELTPCTHEVDNEEGTGLGSLGAGFSYCDRCNTVFRENEGGLLIPYRPQNVLRARTMLSDKELREILASETEKSRTHFAQIPTGLRKDDEEMYAPWREHVRAALAAMREVARRSI